MTHRFIIIAVLASASATAVPAIAQTAPAARPAAQSLQPISRAELIQRIDSTFAAADTNKDGVVDRAELEAAHTRLLEQRRAQLIVEREAAFRHLDTNRDGVLTLEEFNAVAAAPVARPNVTPTLDRFDTNKDGRINPAENRGPMMADFDRADTNRDGILSVEEQRAAARR